jgi:hypothetical protein
MERWPVDRLPIGTVSRWLTVTVASLFLISVIQIFVLDVFPSNVCCSIFSSNPFTIDTWYLLFARMQFYQMPVLIKFCLNLSSLFHNNLTTIYTTMIRGVKSISCKIPYMMKKTEEIIKQVEIKKSRRNGKFQYIYVWQKRKNSWYMNDNNKKNNLCAYVWSCRLQGKMLMIGSE